MRKRVWKRLLAIVSVAGVTLVFPLTTEAAQQGRGRGLEGHVGLHDRRDVTSGRTRTSARIYQDPASANGYEEGYELGLSDGRGGQRYDPVRHREYRDAEEGYDDSYGPKDGYKKNFRTGFRQGYEDGYRVATGSKR